MWRSILLCTGLCLASSALGQQPLTSAQWREDLEFYKGKVETAHIAPFHTITRENFEAQVADLASRVDRLERHQIIVELARITASVGDGHTGLRLTPRASNGFHQYPILLYWMDGELYVLGIAAEYAHLTGGRLVRIGDVTAADAFERASPLAPRDNIMGVRSAAARYLALPEVLEALGLSQSVDQATYEIERPGGGVEEVTLDAIPDAWLAELSWLPWLHRTAEDKIAFTMAYDTASPPLWLAHADRRFWFTELPESNAHYVQLNAIGDTQDETMDEFFGRVFAAVDSLRPARFVLDLRLNGGGNNMLNLPVVLELVRRPWLDQRGKVYVLISRHTFSAASHFVTYTERLTNAVFVGEPTGGSPNHYGDAPTFALPNSGVEFRLSSLYWQNSLPDRFERRDWTAPDLAAPMTIESYRDGEDPALALALNWEPEGKLIDQLRACFAEGRIEQADEIRRAYRANPLYRWVERNASELNNWGYDLLGRGHTNEAIAVFRIIAADHPKSANAFDSLGDGYLAAGDTTAAIGAWREALRIDPSFTASAGNLERLGVKR